MMQPIFQIAEEPKEKKRRRRRIIIFNSVVDGLIIAALIYIGLVYGPFLYSEASYYVRQVFGKTYILAEDSPSTGPSPANTMISSIVSGVPEIAIKPKDTDFGIVIEKIGVNESVVANVDPDNRTEYRKALKKGVAHAAGTAYPGEVGNVYIFAHSTANVWDAVSLKSYFTLLRKLEVGDRVILFYNGDRYDYEVYEKMIISPSDTSDLTGHAEEPILTLQTCDPPGSASHRLIVKAKLVAYKLGE
jgi:LPXTG-site transpeptidase (sortase) family protein